MKFLLVENKVRITKRIQQILADDGHTCLLASDGMAGRKMVQGAHFDFLLINSDLPKLNGIDLCKCIRGLKPDIPIIILASSKMADNMSAAFDAGADDCLLQPFDLRELLVRIHALMKRKHLAEPEQRPVLTYADVEMNLDTRIVKRNGTEINLTPREFALLEYLLRNTGKILSRAELAQHVWNTPLVSGANFVDVYITYLRKKVDKPFSVKLIHTKHWQGYVFRVEDYGN